MTAQLQGIRFTGPEDLLFFFGERNQRGRFDFQCLERRDSGIQLPFTAIDQDDVRKNFALFVQFLVTTRYNLMNTGEIVYASEPT